MRSVWSVSSVWFILFVGPKEPNRPDRPDRPDEQDRRAPDAGGLFSILLGISCLDGSLSQLRVSRQTVVRRTFLFPV